MSSTAWTLCSGALAAALVLPPAAAPASAQEVDPAAREWNQLRGNAGRTCTTTVRPVRAAPEIAWRADLPGKLYSDPVTWGGVVFVVAGNERKRDLLAFRAATGEALGRRGLGKGGWVDIATWQGVVIVCDPDQLRGFPHKGTKFAFGWRKKGDFGLAPCVSYGTVFVGGPVTSLLRRGPARALLAFDARSGRALESGGGHVEGVPTILRTSADAEPAFPVAYYTKRARYQGTWLYFGAPNRPPKPVVTCKVRRTAQSPCIVRMGRGWLVTGKYLLHGASGLFPGVVIPDVGDVAMSSIAGAAAVYRNVAYGFSTDGKLIEMDSEGRFRVLVEPDTMPEGARKGEPTIAQDVICFGNWAVEIESGRVLWSLAEIDPMTPAVPVADGRIVCGTKSEELVCLADPTIVPRGEPAASGGEDGGRASAPSIAPGSRDGVFLAGGRHETGAADVLPNGGIRVRREGQPALEVAADEFVVAVEEGQVTQVGEEPQVLVAWRDHLREATVDMLAGFVEDGAKRRLLTAARRLLAEARAFGARGARADALEALFTGKSAHPNENLKTPRFLARVETERAALFDRFLAGADWCETEGLPGAAAALLNEAWRLCPDDPRIEERGRRLLPPGFPWADGPRAGRTWVRWAASIAPAGARFLEPGDPAWEKAARTGWRATDVIGFRTRNLLFFSRESSPAVVGGCLRHGEGAVRALERLLGGGDGERVTSDDQRLDVRLLPDRESYLKDIPGGGALAWSAGVYMPSQRVSRFFVDREGSTGGALGRSLFDTLAHELTHHYVHVRMMRGRSAGVATPGYWIVEGIATFVGDQSVEMGRRGGDLDDPTVSSIDASTQAAKAGRLIPMARFVDLTHLEFGRLSTEPDLLVQLRNTLGGRQLSQFNVFYEQAGSLTFFLLRRRGAAGARSLVKFIRSHYSNQTRGQVWKELGFASAAELDAAYRRFLKDPPRTEQPTGR